MSFQTYTTGIPDAPNNPSTDQPNMKVNNDSNSAIWLEDHYGFNDNLGGEHKQVTYSKLNIGDNVPGVPADPNSVTYTNAGIAAPTHPQAFYRNSQGIFPMSAIRAFASFDSRLTAGVATVNNSFNLIVANPVNCTSVSSSRYIFTIELLPNATNTNDVIVFASAGTDNTDTRWSYAAPILTASFARSILTQKLSVIVIQI